MFGNSQKKGKQQCPVAYIDHTASTPAYIGVLFVCLDVRYVGVPLGVTVTLMLSIPACVQCVTVAHSLALLGKASGFESCPTERKQQCK